MANDLTIQAAAAMRVGSDTAGSSRAPATEPIAAQEPPAASPVPNPSLRLNAALGLVVIEFRNDAGTVTSSIPSQRQLEAYQRWETTRFGPAPTRQSPSRPDKSAPVVQASATKP